jgi:hypothetical protein
MFLKHIFNKTGIPVLNAMKKRLHPFLTGFNLLACKKYLEVDPTPEFKYSHLKISGPMHYRKMVSLKLLFVSLSSRIKTG